MANLPVSRFLTARLQEYDPDFEVRRGSGFERLFFQPVQFILQPIRDEAESIRVAQSFNLILAQADPNSFDEESVDALASNIFVFRRQGGFAAGVARVFFQNPVDREYPTGGFVVSAGNGSVFENSGPFKITAEQMSVQVENGLYFFDIAVVATEEGSDAEIGVDELVEVTDDDQVIRVTNPQAFSGGADKETNTELIERAQSSIGVRDLLVPKGFNAILFENFKDFLLEVQAIGFGDFEMMRDIVFNTHIGGRTDGYAKTTNITRGTADFVGLLIDTTRQTKTATNVVLNGVVPTELGNQNVARSNGLDAVVKEIKLSFAGEYQGTVDLTTPVDLSTNQYVQIGIDGNFKDIRVAGVTPAQTTRTEIINAINSAFGINVAFQVGFGILIKSTSVGLTSQVVIANPNIGNSAINDIFGLSVAGSPHIFQGDGPVTFFEGVHYSVNDIDGEITRIEGPLIVSPQTSGESVDGSTTFEDATPSIFANVQERDVLRITSGSDVGDYRVLNVLNDNQIVLDAPLTTDATGLSYQIYRSGIKSGELVMVEYHYNPLSIDIGANVALQTTGDPLNPIVLERGLRPGRQAQTITDTSFLRIVSVEEIDALTGEPTGFVLDGSNGFGQGGFGRGGFGIGEGQDYFLVVNSPYERFSVYEDSYIVLRQGLQGGSYRVTYDYVPEIQTLHDFVLSENERVLDGDILMKHFLPAYVSGNIVYRVDNTDSSIISNEALQTAVADFIDQIPAGQSLQYSDIIQFIVRTVDPFDRYGAQVKFFSLQGIIHNMDGSLTYVEGENELEFPSRDPLGQRMPDPLSPRISHWISDNLTLAREV